MFGKHKVLIVVNEKHKINIVHTFGMLLFMVTKILSYFDAGFGLN